MGVDETVLLQNAQSLAFTTQHLGEHKNASSWLYNATEKSEKHSQFAVDAIIEREHFLW